MAGVGLVDILPCGQAYVDGRPSVRAGLGPRLGALSDVLLLQLLGRLDPVELALLGRACRCMHAFASVDELWKAHVLEAVGGAFEYDVSWKRTYIACVARRPPPPLAPAPTTPRPALYSDTLFRPRHCATLRIPAWWVRAGAGSTAVERVRAGELSAAEFVRRFDAPARPVLIEGLAAHWPAAQRWSRASLLRRFGARRFVVGEMQMRLSSFFAYCDGARDDPPLYLFDKHFAATAPELAAEYERAPSPFPEDLFECALGEAARPDWRWLILGGARSGSTWHVDPNRTSAWNAVVRGSKKWLLTPPDTPPPAVNASADGAMIEAPVSVVEWFDSFLAPARRELGGALFEAHARAGDVLFVPRGWWHTALNLEETVALTHNFVSAAGLADTLSVITPERAHDLVSGVPRERRAQLHGAFVDGLRATRPEALAAAERALASAQASGPARATKRAAPAPSLWARVTRRPVAPHDEAEQGGAKPSAGAAATRPSAARSARRVGEAGQAGDVTALAHAPAAEDAAPAPPHAAHTASEAALPHLAASSHGAEPTVRLDGGGAAKRARQAPPPGQQHFAFGFSFA